MAEALRQFDVVAVTTDVPAEHLVCGQVGTIIHVHSPQAFEVEFVDDDGRTYALCTLTGAQLLLLHYSPVKAA